MGGQPRRSFAPCVAAALAFHAGVLYADSASAQTWAGGRTTPTLAEIVAIDATGETGWLYGFEDLEGDGDTFKQQEQSVDIRTAYGAADSARFWARVYVSDPNGAGGNISVYVFIDNDKNASTGGTAEATEIDPILVGGPTSAGFEYVVGIRGNASITGIWEWREQQAVYNELPNVPATQAEAEAGQDVDPVLINGADHGYLQAMVDLDVLGLTSACDADLFVRSVNQSAMGTGDLDVGEIGSCVPADGNGDGVPDVIDPGQGCTTDAECAGGGICVGGECLFAQPCLIDADCDAGEVCDADGHCVPEGGGDCSDNTACNDLVCLSGTCQSCTSDANACGPGRRCAPDGRCIDGSGSGFGGAGGGSLGLQPGDEVQGGACTCEMPGAGRRSRLAWMGLLAAVAVAWRKRRATSIDGRRGDSRER